MRLPHALAIASLVCGFAVSQDPLQPALAVPGIRVPIHAEQLPDQPRAGTWAAGETYKASFHDGMTFVPYLGADYPQNQPWAWQTTSARLGPMELLRGPAPEHRHEDYRYEYHFGVLTEAYDVLHEGLEQTFVLHELPAEGDLVLTGAVTTALHADTTPLDHRELLFRDNQGRGIVGYGRAFAFDAAGDRIDVRTAYCDGRITLMVPGSWLAQARLPVTVDPLLTNVLIATSAAGSVVRDVDIAHYWGSATRRVLIAFVRAASQFDDDVFAIACTDTFANPMLVASFVSSTYDMDDVRCVCANQTWVTAFRTYEANAPQRASYICWFTNLVAATTPNAILFANTPPSDHNDWVPDVGAIQGRNEVLFVFQREDNSAAGGHWANTANSQVMGFVRNVVTGAQGATFLIRGNASTDVHNPSVNARASGTPATWMCAYQVYDYTNPTTWDVEARLVPESGNLAAIGIWTSAFAAADIEHQHGPIVEGGLGRYGVSYSTTDLATTPTKSNSTLGKQVWFERIDWPHAQGSPTASPSPGLIATQSTKVLEATGLGHDAGNASHYAIGFRQTSPPTMWCARVGYRGQLTEGPLVLASGNTSNTVACTGDWANSTFYFAYGINSGVMPVYGQEFPYVTPPPITFYGNGCGTSSLGWYGDQQIGSEFSAVYVSSPVAEMHFPLVSLVPIDVAVPIPEVPAGCRLLGDPAAGIFLPIQVGTACWWYFPMPESWPSVTLYFQDWAFDGVEARGSYRMEVPIVK
jgi:hypothetical protein